MRDVIDQHFENGVLPQREQLETMRTACDLRAWADEAVAQHRSGTAIRCPMGALTAEMADNELMLREALQRGWARSSDAHRARPRHTL